MVKLTKQQRKQENYRKDYCYFSSQDISTYRKLRGLTSTTNGIYRKGFVRQVEDREDNPRDEKRTDEDTQ